MRPFRVNWLWVVLGGITGAYLLFLLEMIRATAMYSSPSVILSVLSSPEIRHATALSLTTCTITAILSLFLAVPVGYLQARSRFPGRAFVDAVLDIPILLPPMVVGLCLLILFRTPLGLFVQGYVPITYTVTAVVIAQFVIGAAFAVRTMRGTFEHLPGRLEDVAMTLGCSRARAIWMVTLPAAAKGMFAAASISWARSLGEFGPILVFAGATRMKTEVLSTSVWMEATVGNLEEAVAVSLLMVVMAVGVLVAVRLVGERI